MRLSLLLAGLVFASVNVATARAADDTAPKAARSPGAPNFFWFNSYQVSVLPLEYGAAINSSGAVVGTAPDGRGVYYAGGVSTPLALLSGFTRVMPVDLVDDGRILARGTGPEGPRALYYYAATASPINISAPRWAEPHAMNNQGVAVGRFGPPGRVWGAFRWTAAGGMADITPAAYDLGWVTDISENGYAVGWVQLFNNVYSYRWNPGGSAGVVLPSSIHHRQALNSGVLVGHSTMGSAIWSPWSLTAVGPDPSRYAVAKISPRGRLIGNHLDAATGANRPWTSIGNGAATLLVLPPGFASVTATDVNSCGTILGNGFDTATNSRRALMWNRRLTCDGWAMSSTSAMSR